MCQGLYRSTPLLNNLSLLGFPKQPSCIFSPCYTNGIGTIYFDAVNGFTVPASDPADVYHIVVEMATETDEGKIPTAQARTLEWVVISFCNA